MTSGLLRKATPVAKASSLENPKYRMSDGSTKPASVSIVIVRLPYRPKISKCDNSRWKKGKKKKKRKF